MKQSLARLLGIAGQCMLLLIAALLLSDGPVLTAQSWLRETMVLPVQTPEWQTTICKLVMGWIAWIAVGFAIFPAIPTTTLPANRRRFELWTRQWVWMALGLGMTGILGLISQHKTTSSSVAETTIPASRSKQEPTAAAPWWPGQAAVLRTLPLRLHLQPSATPEVLLRLLDPHDTTADLVGRSYVTAFAMGKFEQGAWSLSPPLTKDQKQSAVQVFPQRRGRSILHEIQALRRDRETPLLLSLQGRMATDARPVTSPWRRAEWQLLASTSEVPTSESRPLVIDDLTESDHPVSASAVPSCWLEVAVSDEQRQALNSLLTADRTDADSEFNTPSCKQRLIALRETLRHRYQHTLEIDNPSGKEPLSHFLLDEKKGHCELFATAAALAARQMGVPSRVAYGWQGGRPDAAGRWLVFAAEHAHAWAEVLIADQGWVVLDATPLPTQRSDSPSPMAATRAAPELSLSANSGDAHRAWAINWQQHLANLIKTDSVHAAAAALLVVIVSWLTRRWCQTRKHARHQSHSHLTPLPHCEVATPATPDLPPSATTLRPYHTCFLQRCQQSGLQPLPGDTVGQLAARWPQRPPWLDDLVRYHYRTSYERQPRHATTEQQWCELLQAEK